MRKATKREVHSLIGILASIGLFFFLGTQLEMFGTTGGDLRKEWYKFTPFLCLFLGFYFIGYAHSHKQGLKMVMKLVMMFGAAILIGLVLRYI